MTKLKTKRAAAKRFSLTGTGRVKRNHANHRHNLTHKAQTTKVGQRGTSIASDADSQLIKLMIPHAR
ncbi:MAG: 50S ribosomal protein L35 [Pseudomonadota bacterium]